MKKRNILIAVLLAVILLMGAVLFAYCSCSRNTEDKTPEPSDNTEIVEALHRIIGLLENGAGNQASINQNIVARFGELAERIDSDREDIDGIISELGNVFITLYFLEAEIGEFESYDDTEIFGLYNSVLGSLSGLIKDNDILAISHADLLKLYVGLQSVVNGLANDMDNFRFDLSSVITDVLALKQEVSILQADYLAIAVTLDTAYTLINNLANDFNIFRTDITELNNTVAEILLALSALDCGASLEMFLGLQADIAEIQNRLDQHDAALQALQDDGLLSDNSALDGRIGNLESIVSALEYTVSYLAYELSLLQGQSGCDCNCYDYYWEIYTLSGRLDALENEFYQINSLISDYWAFDSRLYNLEWEFYYLQTQMWDLENRIEELQARRPVELLYTPLTYNPDNPQENIMAVPYETSWQLTDKDSFKITYGVFFEGGIFIARVMELRVFFVEGFSVVTAMDGISMLGVEWLVLASLVGDFGDYTLQFEMSAFPTFWDIAQMRILSVEYAKG